MKRSASTVTATIIACVSIVAACAAGTDVSDGEAINLIATEYAFTPSKASVPAGDVRLTVENTGEKIHDLVIERMNGEAPLLQMEPGERAETLISLRPGIYLAYCNLGGHRNAGMEMTLVVTPTS